MPYLLGLTGGIGSGKSTAAAAFARLGVPVVDADALSRAVTAAGGRAIEAVRAHFGDTFITPEGAMDRSAMRELVFSDPEKRRELERVLAPHLEAEISEGIRAALDAARERALPYALFDCPLLAERPAWRKACTKVLVVDLAEEEQIARVMCRSHLTESAVRAILAAQASRAERLEIADYVLYNGGTPEALERAVQTLHTNFLAACG